MKNITSKTAILLLLIVSAACTTGEEVMLQNPTSNLVINTNGGAITSFTLCDNNVNPFTWSMTIEDMPQNNKKGAPFRGHFICLGRWGDPSLGEISMGIPNNGDIGNIKWDCTQSDKQSKATFYAESQLDYMSLNRVVTLDSTTPIFIVTDRLTNTASIGRLCNIVQHATIGQPFLNRSTIINSNATHGFMQENRLPSPELNSYIWPYAISAHNDTTIDLRRSDGIESYVSTHIFADDIAWVTAYSPIHNLLLGYIWRTSDYPWLNIWHQTLNNEPIAKGLEFGTTGVGAPYQEILSTSTSFHKHPSFFFFDAGEVVEKKFICFIIQVPPQFTGVETVAISDSCIIIESCSDSLINKIFTLEYDKEIKL